MKFYKIFALMYADFLLVKNSKWRIMEYLYFPITTVVIYGLFSLFVSSYAAEAGLIVFIVNIMWSFALIAQTHINMSMNEDSWSGSLKQIIITGISDFEYLTARIFSSMIISAVVLLLLAATAVYAFNLAIIWQQWQTFSILFLSTLIASLALSVFVAGAMIALGREYNFLAWTAMQIFILLSAPFYPVSIFPDFIKPLVLIMPYTHIFEATRATIAGAGSIVVALPGLYAAIIYFAVSLPFYKYVFATARKKGWLVRLS